MVSRLLAAGAMTLAVLAPPLIAQTPPAAAPLPAITLPPALDRVLRDYETAWRTGDEAALAALFTPDGFVPTRPTWVRGTAGITATYASSSGDLRLWALAYATADTVGYIVGGFGYGDGAGPAAERSGKFLLALRRGPGGRWLIAADLDN